MSRSAEFGLGATYEDNDGNTRNAVEAVGGKRDGNQARMLPPVEPPILPRPRLHGPYSEVDQREMDRERELSRGS